MPQTLPVMKKTTHACAPIFRSVTDPISVAIHPVVLVLLAATHKKAKGSIISNRIGMKCGGIVLQVNIH